MTTENPLAEVMPIYGPAMTALNPQHRLWVLAMFEQGTMNGSDAARAAGYSDPGGSGQRGGRGSSAISVTAHRIAHRPDVKAAMQEEARRRVTLMLPVADKYLAKTAANEQHKDQIRAIAMIYNRAGVPETQERTVNVNVTLTTAQKVQRVRELAEKHGMNVDGMLGTITDAEYTEVKDDPYADEEY